MTRELAKKMVLERLRKRYVALQIVAEHPEVTAVIVFRPKGIDDDGVSRIALKVMPPEEDIIARRRWCNELMTAAAGLATLVTGYKYAPCLVCGSQKSLNSTVTEECPYPEGIQIVERYRD